MIKVIKYGDSISYDSGLAFGQGAFETILVKKNCVMLDEHIFRINNTLKYLNINKVVDKNQILKTIKDNDIKECIVKLICTQNNIFLTTRSNNYTDEIYNNGFKITLSNVRRNETSQIVKHKTLNYFENILEREKAVEKGFDEVIFINSKGYLAEGSVSNLFFVVDNKIYTPNLECGLLDGTIRKWIINNYDVIEGQFNLDFFKNAEEIFLTNSIMGIMHVRQFDNMCYNSRKISESILKEFRNLGGI